MSDACYFWLTVLPTKVFQGRYMNLIYTGLGKTNGGEREDACL